MSSSAVVKDEPEMVSSSSNYNIINRNVQQPAAVYDEEFAAVSNMTSSKDRARNVNPIMGTNDMEQASTLNGGFANALDNNKKEEPKMEEPLSEKEKLKLEHGEDCSDFSSRLHQAKGALANALPSKTTTVVTTTVNAEGQAIQSASTKLYYDLSHDIYTVIFLGRPWHPGFIFAITTALLKLSLYLLLSIELGFNGFESSPKSHLVRLAQFIILPVAVAIQSDLMTSFTKIANVAYDPQIMTKIPDATRTKFFLSIACRFLDGLFSISVNFVLLLQAPDVLSLLLNFAALQFLQDIDNVAFNLAEKGYLTERVARITTLSHDLRLPHRQTEWVTKMDTGLFILAYIILLVLYIWCTAFNWEANGWGRSNHDHA